MLVAAVAGWCAAGHVAGVLLDLAWGGNDKPNSPYSAAQFLLTDRRKTYDGFY